MKTFTNPENAIPINEFTYEGCKYDGIAPGLSFSVLSDGLADFLIYAFPQLVEATEAAPVADNAFCCSKCNKDCGSKFMKERHEKVCKAEPVGMAPILKPSYIFWNYKDLDRTQLTEDQLIPSLVGQQPSNAVKKEINEKEIYDPMPGKEGMGMIGRTMQKVTTDREGVEWYGEGLTDDPVK